MAAILILGADGGSDTDTLMKSQMMISEGGEQLLEPNPSNAYRTPMTVR